MKTSFAFFLVALLTANLSYAQGSFTVAGTDPFPTLSFAVRMIWGDYDNDNDIDVLYQNGNTSGVGIAVMINNGGGTYTTINANGSGTFSSGPFSGITFSMVNTDYAVDYDYDGDVDVVEQTNAVAGRVLINTAGSFSVAGTDPFPTLAFAVRMIWGDYDGDGDKDVLYQNGNSAGVGIAVMINNGGGTYTTINANGSGTFSSGPFNGITFSMVNTDYAVDYDNDGDFDIVEQTNAVAGRVLINTAGSFSVAGTDPFPTLAFAVRMIWGDYDSDGDIDVLYQNGNSSGVGIAVMVNNGNGTYTTINANGSGAFSSGPFNGITFSMVNTDYAMDYDNDGDLDLIEQTNATAGRVMIQSGAPPRTTSTVPANNAPTVVRDANIILNFSETVTAGAGNIYIRKFSDNSIVETIAANGARVTGSGTAAITIDPVTVLASNTTYYITFDKNAFIDANGGIFGILKPGDKVINAISTSSFLKFTTSTVLPVVFINFDAVLQAGLTVKVTWATATEQQNEKFVIERSSNGRDFAAIGQLVANGTAGAGSSYIFIDAAPMTGTNYYRLKQVDQDQHFSYYGIKLIKLDPSNITVSIFPNPASALLNIKIVQVVGKPVDIEILNTNGHLLRRYSQLSAGTGITVPVLSLPSGQYLLRIRLKDETRQLFFTVQH